MRRGNCCSQRQLGAGSGVAGLLLRLWLSRNSGSSSVRWVSWAPCRLWQEGLQVLVCKQCKKNPCSMVSQV